MSIRLAEFGRRVTRWSAGILLAPLGLLTYALFFTTGQPVPREFIPVEQLGFTLAGNGFLPDKKGRPTFLWFSGNSRYFITTADWAVGTDHRKIDQRIVARVNFLDTVTMQEVGSFRIRIGSLRPFEISGDRQSVITATNSGLHIQNPESAKEDVVEIKTPWGDLGMLEPDEGAYIVFAPDGRQLLINSERRAVHYDLAERRMISAFQVSPERKIMECFLDSKGRPKALAHSTHSDRLEVWDIASSQVDMTLDRSELEKRGIHKESEVLTLGYATGESVLASMFGQGDLLLVRSLEDGRSLQTHSMPTGVDLLGFSPDGHSLVCYCERPHPMVRLLGGWHESLDEWLSTPNASARFPDEKRLAVVDLRTGKTWLDLRGDIGCAFTDNGDGLISFTEEGRYEYDVPPRWQYCTPWTWAALGAWLSLVAIWWNLRKHNRSVVAAA